MRFLPTALFWLAWLIFACTPWTPPGAPEKSTPDTTRVPPEVMSLRVFAELDLEHPNGVVDDFMEALGRAGIQVVRLAAVPADVKVVIRETRTPIQETAEPHRRRMRRGVLEHVSRIVEITDINNQPIQAIVLDWDSDTLEPTKMSGVALANDFLTSPKLAEWARARSQTK